MNTKHMSVRCKDCKWVHEADNVAKTSFKGVELCKNHAITNELLEALKTISNFSRYTANNGEDAVFAMDLMRDIAKTVIAKTEEYKK